MVEREPDGGVVLLSESDWEYVEDEPENVLRPLSTEPCRIDESEKS